MSGAATWLVALDIDGTVVLEDETPSPGVIDAVAAARARGHEVTLATGRSWESTEHIAALLSIAPDYVVCSNGAVVLRRTTPVEVTPPAFERFFTESFDAREVLDLLRVHLPDAHYLVELPDGRRLYTKFVDDWALDTANLVPFELLHADPVSRVVVMSPEHTDQDFMSLIERVGLNHVSYAVGWTAWLDIAPQGVDKSTALEMVRGWLDIERSQVLVIGDGRNDLGMFAWARENGGRAVAMAQGPQEVRDAASEITTSVTEGGVAAALKTL